MNVWPAARCPSLLARASHPWWKKCATCRVTTATKWASRWGDCGRRGSGPSWHRIFSCRRRSGRQSSTAASRPTRLGARRGRRNARNGIRGGPHRASRPRAPRRAAIAAAGARVVAGRLVEHRGTAAVRPAASAPKIPATPAARVGSTARHRSGGPSKPSIAGRWTRAAKNSGFHPAAAAAAVRGWAFRWARHCATLAPTAPPA